MISEEKVNQAMENLEISEENLSEKNVFDNFVDKFLSAKSKKERSELIGSKITLTLHLDEECHRENRAFRVMVKNYCKKCNSKGYIPEREKILRPENCPDCDGTGIKTVPCKKCKGTGYTEGNLCSVCGGKRVYRLYKTKDRPMDYLCGRCQGTGKIQKVYSGPNIVDFEICSSCKGPGFNISFPALKTTPVRDLGDLITQKMEKHKMPKQIYGKMAEAMQESLVKGENQGKEKEV